MARRKLSTFERLQRGIKLSQRERKQLAARLRAEKPGWELVHRNVAGIDIGNESHHVAVDPQRCPEPVREFGSWTGALHEMVVWLKACGVERVVMQTTGVYWMALYDVLEQAGFQVVVVDARATKNLPGRKSDVQECEWIRKLDIFGLLRACFQVPDAIRKVRTIWRLRQRWVQEAARYVQQMQKALTTMNVQLSNAVSDISGKTGMAILRAIVQGERDPWKLAKLRDSRCQASEEEVAQSLKGNWREEIVFELKQVLEVYDLQQEKIAACEQQLHTYLAAQPSRLGPGAADPEPTTAGAKASPGKAKKGFRKNPSPATSAQPELDFATQLKRVLGTDLTVINGIKLGTIQTIYAELGPNLSAFPTERHFSSWLLLAPRRDVSGGKVIRHHWVRNRNRVAAALRMAAESLHSCDSYLGARYRSLRGRLGGTKAVKAMARYLACLIYRVLTKGQAWVDRGAAYHEKRLQDRQLIYVQKKAAELGMRLVPATA